MLDIEDKNFWKEIYTIVRATFPALRHICYCDINTPAMDKLFNLSHCTTIAIERSCGFLNDVGIFGTYDGTSDYLEFEETEVFGTIVDSKISEDNGEGSSAYDDL